MSVRTTLALLLVVGLLGGVLWLTNERPDENGNVAVSVLGGHTLDRATRIRWQFRDMQPVEIQRTPGGPFRLTLPIDDLASVAQIRSIKATYDSAQMADQQVEDTEAERRRFGLDQPRCVVDVAFEDGSTQRLELGSEGRMGNDVFVRRGGRIFSGGLGLFTSLQVGIDDLRERTVFDTETAPIRGVRVDQALGTGRTVLEVVREGDGWRLNAPVRARADAQAARSFLMQVLGLHIDQFPPAVVRLPEREPDLKLTMLTEQGDVTVPLWLDPQHNLIGRLEARKITFVCSAEQFATIFGTGAERLRARILFPVENMHASLLTVIVDPGQGKGPRLVLQRNTVEEPWSMVEPVRSPAEPTPVQKLISALNNLRALQFYAGGTGEPKFGFAASGLSVAVQSQELKQPVVVRLGGSIREGEYELSYAARADAADEVVGVPKDAVAQMAVPWGDYVALGVITLTQPVQRLDLKRRTGETRILRRKESGWQADNDTRVLEDVGEIVDEIRDLHGKRALGVAQEPQLGEPDWRLALCRDTGDTFVALDVWERAGKPMLVRSSSRPELAFELAKLHSDMLRKLWQ